MYTDKGYRVLGQSRGKAEVEGSGKWGGAAAQLVLQHNLLGAHTMSAAVAGRQSTKAPGILLQPVALSSPGSPKVMPSTVTVFLEMKILIHQRLYLGCGGSSW